MITKVKSFKEISSHKDGNVMPITLGNKCIGIAIINKDGVTLCSDMYPEILKAACNKPGLSGFSIEVR